MANRAGIRAWLSLRARYERAAATSRVQLAEGLFFLTGLYLAISPWVAGFDAMPASPSAT